MKKFILPVAVVAAFAFASCGGGKWSDDDKKKFTDQCLELAASKGAPEDASKKVCDCTLEKLEKEYSSYADADKGDSNKIKEMMEGCVKDLEKELKGEN